MKLPEQANLNKKKAWFTKQGTIKPKGISVLSEGLIETETLSPTTTIPLVIKPAIKGVNLIAWADKNQDLLKSQLLKHGAILFRNFEVQKITEFEEFIKTISGGLLEYRERSSPRSQVSGHVYTSTDYPAKHSIFPHNEHSYSHTWPMKLFFFCVTPAEEGGETPIADCRRVLQHIDPKIVERFREKKWMYVRNYGDGFGLSWQTVFQTTERIKVEEYCRCNDIEFEWKDGDRLKTSQIREAIATHPQTGEHVWFNHATFFHVSTLESPMRETLLAEFKEENLPNNTYYGDGSPIEPSVLNKLRQAYLDEAVAFRWKSGDILMLDNMLTAHSRRPFVGPRRVLFGMSEPYSYRNI
ncbi:taurine catabolism dioxygenase TauD [Nostocales cyanobacterium HT-58-2]|nr:taurine catabolism dioxygenase TauD [Nostocales cyanobacterium HT-58-2]